MLGLSGKVTRSEVKRTYRRLMKKYHPDRWQSASPEHRRFAETRTKEINLAYAYFRSRYGL
jgi:DnaJ-class molecular chaperone